jgi:hypothetical protein
MSRCIDPERGTRDSEQKEVTILSREGEERDRMGNRCSRFLFREYIFSARFLSSEYALTYAGMQGRSHRHPPLVQMRIDIPCR